MEHFYVTVVFKTMTGMHCPTQQKVAKLHSASLQAQIWKKSRAQGPTEGWIFVSSDWITV